MRVVAIGTGYVGLVSGVCLSHLGHHVTCVDIEESKIKKIRRGISPIFEPGLAVLLKQEISDGRFRVTTDLGEALKDADIALIAVGTPSAPDGSAGLSWIEAAGRDIARYMRAGLVVAIKSTVPVGTGRHIKNIIRAARPGLPFSIGSNPEFLREGRAITDFMHPDRVVIGTEEESARCALRQLYEPLQQRGIPILETNVEGAELIKYAANSFLATKIAFINEVSALCERVGADVDQVAAGMGLDARIGKEFLKAGPGYGGSCFPKDTRAFVAMGEQNGARQTIAAQVVASNEECKARVANRILELLGPVAAGKTAAILGLAFKPNTDDVRESVSLSVIRHLRAAGVRLQVHDYAVSPDSTTQFGDVSWCNTPYDAALDSDLVAVLTDWADYATLDLARIAGLMRGNVIVDTRRILRLGDAGALGLDLRLLGVGGGIGMRSDGPMPAAVLDPKNALEELLQ